jgi:hypothetical protein
VCMGLVLARGLGLRLRLSGCFGKIFGRKFQSLSAMEVLCSSCSSSLMTHYHQNQCSTPALGSCDGSHHNDLLGLRLVWLLSVAAQACESAESQIC